MLSVEYSEALMAAAGADATTALADLDGALPNGYIAVVEGAIPTADSGVYATLGGRPMRDVVREVCAGALGTIAVGRAPSTAALSAAAGGLTGAVGVGRVVEHAAPGQPARLPGQRRQPRRDARPLPDVQGVPADRRPGPAATSPTAA